METSIKINANTCKLNTNMSKIHRIRGDSVKQNTGVCISYLASSYRPVTSINPRNAMKVSRPQQRIKPVEKWGKPAAMEGSGKAPSPETGISWGDRAGSDADCVIHKNCAEPRDNALTNDEPSTTKLQGEKRIAL